MTVPETAKRDYFPLANPDRKAWPLPRQARRVQARDPPHANGETAMYQVGGTTVGAGLVLGGATQLPGPGQALAREMLPFTGFACGLLLLVGVLLVVVGLAMRKFGAVDA